VKSGEKKIPVPELRRRMEKSESKLSQLSAFLPIDTKRRKSGPGKLYSLM
jgi:hypothetical protein